MKKPIITITLAVFFIPGIFLTGCNSPTQKAEDANENVLDAREDLEDAKQEANTTAVRAANDEEWKAFKIDADAKIKQNELRIAELKIKLQKPGKGLEEADKRRIDDLEKKNDALESQMNDYEKNKGDWESYKREFNHDMDELGKALEAMPVDKK